jgi:hypothetical protein
MFYPQLFSTLAITTWAFFFIPYHLQYPFSLFQLCFVIFYCPCHSFTISMLVASTSYFLYCCLDVPLQCEYSSVSTDLSTSSSLLLMTNLSWHGNHDHSFDMSCLDLCFGLCWN